jgi:hypothetical protein
MYIYINIYIYNTVEIYSKSQKAYDWVGGICITSTVTIEYFILKNIQYITVLQILYIYIYIKRHHLFYCNVSRYKQKYSVPTVRVTTSLKPNTLKI